MTFERSVSRHRKTFLAGRRKSLKCWAALGVALLGVSVLDTTSLLGAGDVAAAMLRTPSRSRAIPLARNERRLVVVNREANSVSIIEVKDRHGNDVANKV